MNKPTIGDDGIDWDKEARRVAADSWPRAPGGSLLYLNEFIPKYLVVLDLGCNIGAWQGAWKELRPDCEYHGLDFSPIAIEIARERYPNCEFHLMNATKMSFDSRFNVVFTHAVLQHMSYKNQITLVPKSQWVGRM